MSNKSTPIVVTMGIDIGKNSFHVIGLDNRGEIVLRQRALDKRASGRCRRRTCATHMAGPRPAITGMARNNASAGSDSANRSP
jgi:hypothetical protein